MILFDGTGTDPIYRVPAVGGTRTVAVGLDHGTQGNVGRLAAVSSRRQALPLPRERREARGQRVLDRVRSIRKRRRSWRRRRRSCSTRRPATSSSCATGPSSRSPSTRRRVKITGEPVPLAEKIGTDNVGLARFSVSNDGVLAYRTGETGGRLLWRDRGGTRARYARGSRGLRQPRRCRPRATASPSTSSTRAARRATSGSGTSRAASIRASRSAPATTSGRCGRRTARRSSSASDRERRRSTSTRNPRRARARKSSCSRTTSRSRRQLDAATGSTSPYASRNPKTLWDALGAADVRRQEADPDRRQPVHRAEPDVFAGRALRRVRVERVRPRRDLRADVSRGRREVAGLQRRRQRPELARRREGALLPLGRPEAHGGRDPRRTPTSRPASRRRSSRFGSGRAPRATSTRRRGTGSASSSPPRSAARRCRRRRSS